MVQQMTQQFWKRWPMDYLNQLQQQHKWKDIQPNMMIGTVVLIKEENVSPLRWQRGVVTEVHPGGDNLIRVVTVKTVKGYFKRPIQKLCVLPLQWLCVNLFNDTSGL
jgi:hypothetical protein